MTQIDYQSPHWNYDFRNRKGGLLTFGIIMILFGVLAGCMTTILPFSLIMSRNMATLATTQGATSTTFPSQLQLAGMQSTGFVVSTIGMMIPYTLFTIGMIWTGIGSIQARRWVRPIVLVFGTIWLVLGCLGMLSLAISAPVVLRTMTSRMPAGSAAPPAMVMSATLACSGVFAVLFYIVWPALLVWYYRSADVQRTLEHYDPRPRWTDGIPLPALGMSMAAALIALFTLVTSVRFIVPLLEGQRIAGVLLLTMLFGTGIYGIAAILLYRRRMLGWHLAVWGLLAFNAIAIVTMTFSERTELWRVMGMERDQIQLAEESPMLRPAIMVSYSLAVCAACVVYALRVRKYFNGDGGAAYQEMESPTRISPL